MRSRGGGTGFRLALDKGCYRSVTSMLLRGNVPPQSLLTKYEQMRSSLSVVSLLALAVALSGCGPSGGADKGGHKGGPGGGMPPPEVTVMTVAPKAIPVSFEYVGQTAGS